MDWYEAEVGALEKGLRETPLPEHPAVFYGSSSIRMWSDLALDLHDCRAVNVGFGGSTLQACAYFFERLVPPLHPASLVVYAGDNDLGDGRAPEQVLGFFRALAEEVQRLPGAVSFGFISIKLSPVRTGLRQQIVCANRLIQEEIARRKHAYYIDVFGAMLDHTGQPRRELFLDDGLHLSRAGYRLWAQLLETYRNRIFIPPSPDVRL
jgi:lysophospholipase L1-like esterase